jgi:hypothetical protein
MFVMLGLVVMGQVIGACDNKIDSDPGYESSSGFLISDPTQGVYDPAVVALFNVWRKLDLADAVNEHARADFLEQIVPSVLRLYQEIAGCNERFTNALRGQELGMVHDWCVYRVLVYNLVYKIKERAISLFEGIMSDEAGCLRVVLQKIVQELRPERGT